MKKKTIPESADPYFLSNEQYKALDEEERDGYQKVLVVCVRKTYHDGISEKELYEAVRGEWRISKDHLVDQKSGKQSVSTVFAVSDQIIREVNTVDLWTEKPIWKGPEGMRMLFTGQTCLDPRKRELVGKSFTANMSHAARIFSLK